MYWLKVVVSVLPLYSTTPVTFGEASYSRPFVTREACEDRGRDLARDVSKIMARGLKRVQSTATVYGAVPVCYFVPETKARFTA